MTDQPTPETDDFRPCHLTPSDWPAFARAMEIQRNAARAERDELNRQLSVALKGKRPYSSKFSDETIAAQVKRIAELEKKLNGLFSERDALRADVARLDAQLAILIADRGTLRAKLEGIVEYGKLCNDGAAIVLQQIDDRISAISGNWPDESRALRCLKAAIEGLLIGIDTKNGRDFATTACENALTAIFDQWEAGR